jgi:hypothetical protein
MIGGQPLQVAAPDGRTINATIPHGMTSGESFYVAFPAINAGGGQSNNSGRQNNQSATPVSPLPMNVSGPFMPPIASPAQNTGDHSHVPFSQALDGPHARMSPQTPSPQAPPTPQNNTQMLLLVNVPTGSAPGSTLYVQVPGEDRTLAAKVPPGVTQFHVAYTPSTSSRTMAAIPFVAATKPIPTTNNGQKLILVRVPPGTPPGTTLHVEVPDEPGRILAAQVPPNVNEFQVAYIPRPPRPTLQAYDMPPNHNNVGVNQGAGGMMNNAMLPFIGGAAMGAAGLAMYDHYHHAGYQDYGHYGADAYGDSGAYDYGGDYGF